MWKRILVWIFFSVNETCVSWWSQKISLQRKQLSKSGTTLENLLVLQQKLVQAHPKKKIPKHTRNQKILSFLFSLFFWHSLWTQCISFPMQNVEISSSTQIMIKQIKIWKQNKAEHGKRLQIAKMPPALPYVLKTSCNVLLNTEWKQLRKATLRRS